MGKELDNRQGRALGQQCAYPEMRGNPRNVEERCRRVL